MRRAALVVVVVFATAGCGGSHLHALGAGAGAVPPNTVVFFAAHTDAPHWQDLARAVLHTVPRVAPGVREVDVAILQGGKRVVLTGAAKPRRGASLADDPHYRDMLRDLPRAPGAYAYVRGDLAGDRLLRLPGQVGTALANFRIRFRTIEHPQQTPSNAYLRWRWGAAWLTAHGGGARLRSAGPPLAKSDAVRSVQVLAKPYVPELLDEIPADAQRVVDFVAPPGMFELMERLPPQVAARFPHLRRLDLAPALDALVLGETALYTRPGGEVTLVSSPPDVAKAEQALRQLGLALPHAFIGGQLVLSTKAAGVAALRTGTRKLAGDKMFVRAGVPAEVSGLLYERGEMAAWGLPDGPDATFAVRFSR